MLIAAVASMYTASFGSFSVGANSKRPKKVLFEKISKIDSVLQALVLSFSDQQLIIGLSILIVAFNQHCSLSTYHFGLIIDIACFSTITRLASLISLRVFFQERAFLHWLRMAGMTVILGMIVAGTVVRNQSHYEESLACPVQCAMNNLHSLKHSAKYTIGVIILPLEYIYPPHDVKVI